MTTPMAPEQQSGNILTRKLGPLPMWGWMAIALVIAIAYYLIDKKNSANSASAQGTSSTPTDTTDQSLVPQFVNQTYVNGTPPPAPSVTVNNTVPTGTTSTGTTTTPPTNKPPAPAKKVTYIKYTVHAGDTLQSLAARYHVTVADIAGAPGNVYVKGEVPGDKKVGQQLGTGAGLKTGMKINIPQYS
jgi:LysM repeat protein